MKKMVALLLALMLCFVSACACAAGLAGLGGGLAGLVPGGSKALPDPAEVTEKTGALLSADYAFAADYLCDAYVYAPVGNVQNFMDQYTILCRNAGYSVNKTVVDGADGYSIQNGSGPYAMLVPEYGGQMMLLVQKGMNFELKKKTNYATCMYNNRDYELEVYFTDTWDFFKAYTITFKAERAPFELIAISFPQYARSGDAFYSNKKEKNESFFVLYDNDRYILAPEGSDDIDGAKDFALLKIDKFENVDEGILVEGVFDGSFSNGGVVFENFVFSAIMEL